VESPLKDWADFGTIAIPDVRDERRWEPLRGARERAGDKYLMGVCTSIYERVHFLRGLENAWCDIHENPGELCRLLDILTGMNVEAAPRFAALGFDALFILDDWGLQDRLMISPEKWHELWGPRYKRIFEAAHAHGLQTLLHSCGYILDILDGLIDAGLDVIQLDQQLNMGIEKLAKYRGRITFFCPVDIQAVMPRGDENEIRAYVRRMVNELGTPDGASCCAGTRTPRQ